MSTVVIVAVPLGVVLGLGLWLLSSLIPRVGGPSLASRIAPYVRDLSEEARRMTAHRRGDPGPLLGALAAPVLSLLRAGLSRALGGDALIGRRLRQAGSVTAVERFRSRQLVTGGVGLVIGLAAAVVVWRTGSVPALVGAAAIPVGAVGGVVVPDRTLTRSAERRMRRIGAELPTVLEFLTLSLAAGEGLLDALRRVARIGSGEFAREIAAVVAEVNAGRPLGAALADSSAALELPAWSRCTDQLVIALERGTPLAAVLRAQAQDSRDQASRELIETAGRKEVGMLVPLVFLILPVTVLFAIFPGVLVLQLGF